MTNRVDCSVWIDLLREDVWLETGFYLRLCKSANVAHRFEQALLEFPAAFLDKAGPGHRGRPPNDRFLPARSITMRKTIDFVIGTCCIEHGHALLHSDRDFEPMERLLGLRTV